MRLLAKWLGFSDPVPRPKPTVRENAEELGYVLQKDKPMHRFVERDWDDFVRNLP